MLRKLTAAFCLLSSFVLFAQPGSIDSTFNTADPGLAINEGPNSYIRAAVVQGDGGIVVAGGMSSFSGTPLNMVARLFADGSLDPSFTSLAESGDAYALAIQADGLILVGGEFGSYAGMPCGGLVRLLPDGTLDPSFQLSMPVMSLFGRVSAICIQPDGNILIGGGFSGYQETPRKGIARLLPDGTLDTTFDPGYGVEYNNGMPMMVKSIVVEPGGNIILGGDFNYYDGHPQNGIARSDNTGTLDQTYAQDLMLEGIRALALLPDGKALVAGSFRTDYGAPANGMVLLDANGVVDPGFTVGAGPDGEEYTYISSLLPRSDGSILTAGHFNNFAGQPRSNLALLNAQGVLLPSFDAAAGADRSVGFLTPLSDDRILLGGDLHSAHGVGRKALAAYHGDGTLDQTFGAVSGGANDPVGQVIALPDGRSLIAGYFGAYNGVARDRIAQLLPDGSLDTTFNCTSLSGLTSTAIALQPDGRVLVAAITDYNHNIRMIRLENNGSMDPSFSAWGALTSVSSQRVQALAVQPDGKILVGGDLMIYTTSERNALVRLNADGTLDEDFTTDAQWGGQVKAIAILPDGKILVGGSFENWGGHPWSGIARLNPDGSVDASFIPGSGATGDFTSTVESILIQPDGKILLGGDFDRFNGMSRRGLVRLSPTGALDASFLPHLPLGVQNITSVHTILPGSMGKIVINGDFDSYAGTPRPGIAGILTDGSLDSDFDPGSGPGPVQWGKVMAMQQDGKYLLGGYFTTYDGTGRNRLARINGYADFTEGIAERTVESDAFLLFPNPNAGDRVELRWKGQIGDAGHVRVEVLDAMGRVVLLPNLSTTTASGPTGHGTWELGGGLPQGAYLVRLTFPGRSITRPLLIQPF